jgi:hypothetical protein
MFLEHFEVVGDRAWFRPAGTVSLKEAVELVNDGIACARRQKLRNLLVDTRALHGFNPPSMLSRIRYARRWAISAGKVVRFAVVARPEIVDPKRIGVRVARNRGADASAFVSWRTAARWLDSDRAL